MKIYNYHPAYKIYLGSSDADPSPLEPGAFLIPAHATNIEPPGCSSHEIQVFNGISWEITENCRGIYYSISTQQKIENIHPLEPPENATKEQPPEVPLGKILKWNDGWVLEDIPPEPELTPIEKLEKSGLTVDELKTLLGLN